MNLTLGVSLGPGALMWRERPDLWVGKDEVSSAWEGHNIDLARVPDLAELLENDLLAWVVEERGTFGDFRVRKETFFRLSEAGFPNSDQ